MDKPLYNPLSDKFVYDWLDDNNKSHTLVIEALSIGYFPQNQYDFMKKHLYDAVFHDNGDYSKPDAEKERINKIITIS